MKYKIDLYHDKDNEFKYPWANIELDKYSMLIGMYEFGDIKRKLFTMSKKQVISMANTMLSLADMMEDNNIIE